MTDVEQWEALEEAIKESMPALYEKIVADLQDPAMEHTASHPHRACSRCGALIGSRAWDQHKAYHRASTIAIRAGVLGVQVILQFMEDVKAGFEAQAAREGET